MLMFAGVTDEDIKKAQLGMYPYWAAISPTLIIRFQEKGGVNVPPKDLIGKTIKIVSQPIEGAFIIEIVEGR